MKKMKSEYKAAIGTAVCFIAILAVVTGAVVIQLNINQDPNTNTTDTGTTDTSTTGTGSDTTTIITDGTWLTDDCIDGNTRADGSPKNPENGYSVIESEGILFTGIDYFAGTAVSSVTVDLYGYEDEAFKVQATSGTESSVAFESGQHVKFKASKTGYITYYGAFTVPYHSTDTDTSHAITIKMINDPTSWEQKAEYQNGTEIADAAYVNKTNGDWSTYINLRFTNFNNYDDTGYKSSYNFIRNLWQKAYFQVRMTGTGTSRLNCLSNFQKHTVDASSDVYWYVEMSDADASRELADNGVDYVTNGVFSIDMKLDGGSIVSGDAVTLTYGIVIYGSGDWLKDNNDWGVEESATTDTLIVSYT